MIVYSVWHEDEMGGSGKLIGVFLSREDADRVVSELSAKPSFCDYVDGFTVDQENVDTDREWADGFLGHEGAADYDEWEWKE